MTRFTTISFFLAVFMFMVLSLLTGRKGYAATSSTGASISEGVSTYSDRSLNMSVGAGVAMLAQDLGWGVNVAFDRQVDRSVPVYMGLDLGLHTWGGFSRPNALVNLPNGVTEVELTTLHLLPTFYYRFDVLTFLSAYPYLGLSVGPSIVLANGTAGGYVAHDATILPELLVRPGMTLYVTPTFGINVEPKFGVLRSEFVFLPQFNATVSL